MNIKLLSMFPCFLPYRDSCWENMGKKIGWKILPKDSKRMRLVQIFGIWAVQELPFHLRYHSFGSLMPDCHCCWQFHYTNSALGQQGGAVV
jgi:hypothetical protein